ncbi:MAG TPA: putative hydro-lyase [Candidatus Baltobacteraceae bacterium]|nr:putative hydro-lyase [Candidatus Baltobacteraceae bacterium]
MTDPRAARLAIRQGQWRKPTAGLAPGFVQTNLVILPRALAFDFLLFAQRNPKPCPVIEVMDPGSAEPKLSASGADLRTDIPKYCIYEDGTLKAQVTDLTALWHDDLVSFLLGCSFTFEAALLAAGVPVRHIEEDRNVPMYISSLACVPAGLFRGPLVVTMRPIPAALVSRAVQITGRYPGVHGAPVHIGDPAQIGINDLNRPDFGEAVSIRPGEVPVFWACGVTPQAVAMHAKPPLMITHAPGHMFITDLKNETLATG